MDETELADHIDGLSSGLAVWHDGPPALARILAMCTLERLRDERDLLEVGVGPMADQPGPELEDPRYGDHRDRWRHAVSTVIVWHGRFGRPNTTRVPAPAKDRGARGRAGRRVRRQSDRTVTERDYEVAVRMAADFHELDPIRVGCRTGGIEIHRVAGRHVWLSNRRRADVEVLDILLARVTACAKPEAPDGPDPITGWFVSRSLAPRGSRGLPPRHPEGLALLNRLPNSLRTRAWVETEQGLQAQGSSVGETLDLGGLSFGEARACYAFLISQLQLNRMAAFHFATPEAMLWGIRPHHLEAALSSRVDRKAAGAFIRMCTYSKGRSPISAPLVPSGELLLIPSEVVSPIAYERALLRAAAAEPSAAGRLGNLLGRRAVRWAERLREIPGCQVATEVVVRADGQTLGDLDVVAWDAAAQSMAIFETKWPVDAATLSESFKVDATFDKGAAQLLRLRTAIDQGRATVDWPRAWGSPTDVQTSWWVGSAQQLDSRPDWHAIDIERTSLRMLEQLLPASSLDDLLLRLRRFTLPRCGYEYDLHECSIAAGSLTIHYEALALSDESLVPPPDRRIDHGWT